MVDTADDIMSFNLNSFLEQTVLTSIKWSIVLSSSSSASVVVHTSSSCVVRRVLLPGYSEGYLPRPGNRNLEDSSLHAEGETSRAFASPAVISTGFFSVGDNPALMEPIPERL